MFAQPVPAESSRFELSQGHYWLTLHGLARNLRDFSHETMRDSVSREFCETFPARPCETLVSREVSVSQGWSREKSRSRKNPIETLRDPTLVQGHRRYRIFLMRRRRACLGDHGTGGGGTLSPPLGTATHRYIFPYILFGMCTDIHCNRVIKW